MSVAGLGTASSRARQPYAADSGERDNGPLSLLPTTRRPCGPSAMDQPGGRRVSPRLVAAPVTGVGSWVGRGCRRMCNGGLPTALVRPWGVLAATLFAHDLAA